MGNRISAIRTLLNANLELGVREVVRAYKAKGYSVRRTAEHFGVHRMALSTWRKKFPALKAAMDKAKLDAAMQRLQVIDKDADLPEGGGGEKPES